MDIPITIWVVRGAAATPSSLNSGYNRGSSSTGGNPADYVRPPRRVVTGLGVNPTTSPTSSSPPRTRDHADGVTLFPNAPCGSTRGDTTPIGDEGAVLVRAIKREVAGAFKRRRASRMKLVDGDDKEILRDPRLHRRQAHVPVAVLRRPHPLRDRGQRVGQRLLRRTSRNRRSPKRSTGLDLAAEQRMLKSRRNRAG